MSYQRAWGLRPQPRCDTAWPSRSSGDWRLSSSHCHELGVEAALDLADEAARDVQSDLVVDVAAVRKDDDVARLQHDHAMRRALVGKCVHHAGAPVVEASR